jgi:alanine racemase
MTRVGVQVADVDRFVDFIESRNMIVEGMFTHFADAWMRPSFTESQLEKFELATAPYKGSKLRHVSGSAGIIRKYGVGYDLIRPGQTSRMDVGLNY